MNRASIAHPSRQLPTELVAVAQQMSKIGVMDDVASRIRSDSLPDLRKTFDAPQLRQIAPPIFQLGLVLDASVVLADIRWLEMHRQDESARSKLQEVLDAETVVPYAPSFLKTEIEQKLPLIAAKNNLSYSSMWSHWLRYEKRIRFVEMGHADDQFDDPFDAPYVKLQRALNMPVLTQDGDFRRMGSQSVDRQVVIRLCAYSRTSAVEYTLKATGVSATTLVVCGAHGLINGVQSTIAGFRRLPPSLQACLIVAAGFAVIHPSSRKWILESLENLAGNAKSAGVAALTAIAPIAEEHELAKQNSANALVEVQNLLDASEKSRQYRRPLRRRRRGPPKTTTESI